MLFGGTLTSVRIRVLPCVLCIAVLAIPAAAQDRPVTDDQEPAAAQDFEDVMVHVPSMAVAGRILREVGIAKAQEGIPQGDGEPKFDTQNNKLYFRTSRANVATMKKILARIEKGGSATSRPAETPPAAKAEAAPFFAIEIWLIQLQLPKGETLELTGPRGEVLTVLGGLEKESKAEVLNHVYLAAEEGRSAQSMLSESVPIIKSMAGGGGVWMGNAPPRSEAEARGGAPGGRGPVMTSVSRESLGTQFKVTANSAGNGKVMLDYVVSKSFLGKEEEGTLIPTDTSGAGVRQPTTRLFEIESSVRAQLGNVVTASSQMRGGEKPTEIRVLILVNPL